MSASVSAPRWLSMFVLAVVIGLAALASDAHAQVFRPRGAKGAPAPKATLTPVASRESAAPAASGTGSARKTTPAAAAKSPARAAAAPAKRTKKKRPKKHDDDDANVNDDDDEDVKITDD